MKTRKGLLKRSIQTFECEENNPSDDYYEDCIPNNKEPLQIGDYATIVAIYKLWELIRNSIF